MNDGITVLTLVNFGYIALLPRKFFKRGAKLNLQWWLTAGPLFVAPAMIALSHFGYLPTLLAPDDPWLKLMSLPGVMISTLSMVLIGFAIGTHRVPIHMFHDTEDRKVSNLVTYGPYQFIRHPIYTSYILALIAAAMTSPSIGTLFCLVFGFVVLDSTAKKEEVMLASPEGFGQEYADYMKTTGRFFPPLGSVNLTGRSPETEQPAAEHSHNGDYSATLSAASKQPDMVTTSGRESK